MKQAGFQGVICPILTPFDSDHGIVHGVLIDHARWALDQGAHYISPFGTTGEATSVGIHERIHALNVLAASGIAPERMMPGTGLCALPDTVELTRHAHELGCAAVMVLPPFYYPHSEQGLFDYYARLIDAVGAPDLRVCLYHIPQMSGVAISPALTARLASAFPEVVCAYKDSSGDWDNARAVIEAAPSVSVFPASENQLELGMRNGAAGCISATMNSQPARVRAAYDALTAEDADAYAVVAGEMVRHRDTVQKAGFIPALKAMTAVATGDHQWLNIRAPMENTTLELGKSLVQELDWKR